MPGIQANAVGKAFTQITGEGAIIFGDIGLFKLVALVVIVSLLAIIIFGGIKRIARFAEFVVPFMASCLYSNGRCYCHCEYSRTTWCNQINF